MRTLVDVALISLAIWLGVSLLENKMDLVADPNADDEVVEGILIDRAREPKMVITEEYAPETETKGDENTNENIDKADIERENTLKEQAAELERLKAELARLTIPEPVEPVEPVAPAVQVPSYTKWNIDLADAQNVSKQTGKPLLIFWSTTGCPKCEEVKTKVLPTPAVAKIVHHDFIPVWKFITGTGDKDAEKYGITLYPKVIIEHPSKDPLGFTPSAVPEEFLKQLEKNK